MYRRVITDVIMHKLQVDIYAVLYLRGVDPAQIPGVVKIFTDTDLADVDNAEADIIATGIDPNDYQVDLEIEFTKLGEIGSRTIALETFMEQVGKQLGRDGKPLYQVSSLEAVSLACQGALPRFPDDGIVVVPDLQNPSDGLLADARLKNPSCEDLDIIDYRVGTAFQYPEYKLDWGKKKIKIGRCWTWIWWPDQTYTRTRKYVLYADVVAPPSIRRSFERAIRDCLQDSALETGILVLVTGGMSLPAAVTVFVTACQQCLETKLEDGVKCVIPDLKLVTEIGDWHDL